MNNDDTYRNSYGDLMCAAHHTRLVVPPLPSKWDRRRGIRAKSPWCTYCRREQRRAS